MNDPLDDLLSQSLTRRADAAPRAELDLADVTTRHRRRSTRRLAATIGAGSLVAVALVGIMLARPNPALDVEAAASAPVETVGPAEIETTAPAEPSWTPVCVVFTDATSAIDETDVVATNSPGQSESCVAIEVLPNEGSAVCYAASALMSDDRVFVDVKPCPPDAEAFCAEGRAAGGRALSPIPGGSETDVPQVVWCPETGGSLPPPG